MSKEITSFAQLETELMKAITDTMIDITIQTEILMREHIQEDVYNVYNPKDYVRTMDFLHSVDSNIISQNGEIISQVFNNINKMNAIAPSKINNYIGQHYSTYPYKVDDYREFMAETINFGIQGVKRFGNGVFSRKRPYFTNTSKIVKASFRSDLIKGLNKRGITTV